MEYIIDGEVDYNQIKHPIREKKNTIDSGQQKPIFLTKEERIKLVEKQQIMKEKDIKIKEIEIRKHNKCI
jgi:hypothetical protein